MGLFEKSTTWPCPTGTSTTTGRCAISVPPSSRPDTSNVFCASNRSATRGRNSGGIIFGGLVLSCSSVGKAYCHGCVGGRSGTGLRLDPTRGGRPCTTSGSSGVPRPVGRPPPPPPPRPPPAAAPAGGAPPPPPRPPPP